MVAEGGTATSADGRRAAEVGPGREGYGLFAVGVVRGIQSAGNYKPVEGRSRPQKQVVEGLLEGLLDVGGLYPLSVRFWEKNFETGEINPVGELMRKAVASGRAVRLQLFKSRYGELRVFGLSDEGV